MTKRMISIFAVGVAAVALAVGPALADKITKVDGKNVEMGSKKIEVSGTRSTVTIGGKASNRDALKVGMDCKATPDSGEVKTIDCK